MVLTQAAQRAEHIGILAGFLAIALPTALWFFIMRPWRPRSRLVYALRFSLWPLVVTTFMLGGPLARAMTGIPGGDVGGTLQGIIGIAVVAAPFCFGIGYARSKLWLAEQAIRP